MRVDWRNRIGTSAFALLAVSSVGAKAADQPGAVESALAAVSAINARASIFGGAVQDQEIVGGSAALTIPLGEAFGAQLDGLAGEGGGAPFVGTALHVFWRDPSKALIGVYGSYVTWDFDHTAASSVLNGGVIDTTGAETSKLAFEGEVYLDRLTLEGLAGYQFGSHDGFTGRGTVAYYPTDDLRFDLSVREDQGPGPSAAAGAEWAPAAAGGLAFFGNVAANRDGDVRAFGGLTVYFGQQQKTLIRRHREDDPAIGLPDDLFTLVGDDHCPTGTVNMGSFCDGAL